MAAVREWGWAVMPGISCETIFIEEKQYLISTVHEVLIQQPEDLKISLFSGSVRGFSARKLVKNRTVELVTSA